MINPPVKVLLSVAALLLASWELALFWCAHGSWWISHRPEQMVTAIHIVAKPILSAEVWEAEEQVDFLSFWLPTIAGLVFTTILAAWLRNLFLLRTEIAKAFIGQEPR